MLVSIEWLKDFVDIDCSPEELQAKLVKSGFEIEEIIRIGENCKNVCVGRIDRIDKHPDADKLQICSVNIGADENVQIVTGADNIKTGDLVPVALDNSDLPNGVHIKKGKLRGVASCGMLCSGQELCLTEADYEGAEVNGILILKDDYPLGTDINIVLDNDDVVLDVGVTANRPDCNSVLGIAREVAAALNKPIKMPSMEYKTDESESIGDYLNVNVLSEICPRYMAHIVKDVVIKQSPKFIRKRLKSVGIRSINNIVDITNYVLTEIGQPMHAFDYSCIKSGVINVRMASVGEKITALDKKSYDLDETILVIADGENPSAIAGVMGGEDSGISDSTKTVVFESANFAKESIRRTSRKLNLRSDSSSRYERGIDLLSQELGLKRALSLIYQTNSGIIVSGTIDKTDCAMSLPQVTCTVSKINSILGIEISANDMTRILNSLNIETVCNDGILICNPPLYRDDIQNANDLAEEIIRLYGYDSINCTLLDDFPTIIPDNKDLSYKNYLKDILVGDGCYEVLSYSFSAPKMFDALNLSEASPLRNAIRILNPLGEDFSIMKTTLAYGMLDIMAKNIKRSNKNLRFFEIARVYLAKELPLTDLPDEINKIVIGISGENEDFYTLKGIIEDIADYVNKPYKFVRSTVEYLHPGISADLILNGKNIGYLGEIHPNVAAVFDIKEKIFIAELDCDAMYSELNSNYAFKPIPKYPGMLRDIAVIVDESISAGEIIDCIKQSGGKILSNAKVFDVYRGKGIVENKKSVAVNIEFTNMERTLVDDEVNAKIDKILKKLRDELGAELR